jgi:indolepyruvate ferredoxin oxidoreductase alpha subunit
MLTIRTLEQQNEQDNRFIAEQAYLPVLEPSSPQEAKDMMVDAFRMSEQFGQIFMLRTVTRLSHARGDVKLGEMVRREKKGEFVKNQQFICMPGWAKKNRVKMIERLEKIKAAVDTLPYNRLELVKGAKYGVIACGISYSYAMEALRWLGLEDKVSLLKIGTPHPLPEKLVKQLLSSVSEVLVIEELEPFVENHVKIIAQEARIMIKIHGKDLVPVISELSTRKATEALIKLTAVKPPVDFAQIDNLVKETAAMLPERPPTMCPGCPHRASFHAINVASRKVKKDLGEKVLTGDIGCYSLGVYAPLNAYDTALCMGSGFGIANGVAREWMFRNRSSGDSTFFHSGITPMINAVFNKTKITMVIWIFATSMTGFNPTRAHLVP